MSEPTDAKSRMVEQQRRIRRTFARKAKQCLREAARLAENIDEAFGTEVFYPKLPPEHPTNVKRFRRYVAMSAEHSTCTPRL